MAAFNFPNSPSVNDTYTANGVTFTWNGTIWQRTSASVGAQGGAGAQGAQGNQGTAAGLTIGTSAPGSPSAGDMWWDSDSGLFLTYYNDGNSSQWVELNQGPMGAQGAQGAQGHQGAAGAQGAQGHQGHQGSAGSNASISSNADNRIITGGSGTNLVGESTLTFDGNTLQNLQTNAAANLTLKATSNSFNSLILDSNRSADTQFGIIDGRWNGNVVNRIQFVTGSDGTNKDDGYMAFHTRTSGASLTERLRITDMGDIYAGNADVGGYPIFDNSNINPRYQFRQGTGTYRGFALIETRGDANSMALYIAKSREGPGTGVINSGDQLGSIQFTGADGTNQVTGAQIIAYTSGTIAADRIPTNLSIYTHPDSTAGKQERLRITSEGKFGINYGGTPPSEDVMICTAGQASPGGLSISHLSGGNRYGARLQSISGTNKGLVISELFNSSYSDLAKVNTEFGLKADNTCKTWLCYRSEAGNEGIIDDFNVSSVTDEGTGSFGVYLDRNIHRHGNGWSQAIVFGCYNDGSRQLIAGIGYAPSHGSNNPWWDVEDNYARVNTQRSTDGVKVDAKVFNMAMFGDTGDLDPT